MDQFRQEDIQRVEARDMIPEMPVWALEKTLVAWSLYKHGGSSRLPMATRLTEALQTLRRADYGI